MAEDDRWRPGNTPRTKAQVAGATGCGSTTAVGEPWRDWYLQWFSPRAEPSSFVKWKLMSTAINVTRAYWAERQDALAGHAGAFGGGDPDLWPAGRHTTVELYRPYVGSPPASAAPGSTGPAAPTGTSRSHSARSTRSRPTRRAPTARPNTPDLSTAAGTTRRKTCAPTPRASTAGHRPAEPASL